MSSESIAMTRAICFGFPDLWWPAEVPDQIRLVCLSCTANWVVEINKDNRILESKETWNVMQANLCLMQEILVQCPDSCHLNTSRPDTWHILRWWLTVLTVNKSLGVFLLRSFQGLNSNFWGLLNIDCLIHMKAQQALDGMLEHLFFSLNWHLLLLPRQSTEISFEESPFL